MDANRENGEEGRMEAKVRDDILDRVMRVLVQEEGGRPVLSKKVKRIMKRYPNIKSINEEETGEADDEETSEEDEDTFSENEEALPKSISAEQQTSQPSFSEDPRTPSPSDYLPEDTSPVRHCISAEQQNFEHSFSEDPKTPSPSDYLPPDIISPLPHHISAERPHLQHPPPEDSNSQDFEDPPTPSPSDYYPDFIVPLMRKRISAERPLQQSSKPQQPPLKRKKTVQPLSKDARPPSKRAKGKPNHVTYVKMESPEEYEQNIRKRIEEVLKIASAGGELITYEQYEKAVIDQPRKGSEVLLRRDIDEIFINNYNSVGLILVQTELE